MVTSGIRKQRAIGPNPPAVPAPRSTARPDVVASIVATGISWPSFTATTSFEQTLIVRPDRRTRPRATSRVPRAGARKLTLHATGKTSAAAGNKLSAAYPQATV